MSFDCDRHTRSHTEDFMIDPMPSIAKVRQYKFFENYKFPIKSA